MNMLAIHGGKPVRDSLLPYGHQEIREEDIHAVVEVLKSDWLTTGPKVDEFEAAFAERVRSRFAVSFSSGTAALHAAAFAADLNPGDEAITTPLTFAATANCVLYQGATPLFADVRQDTLNIDPEKIAAAITPHTKAILPVDYAGNPANHDRIRKIADEHKLIVIEDAAHALGAMYKNQTVGAIHDLTMFSLHPVKHITSGEGGIITTNRDDLRQRLIMFRNHGLNTDARQRQQEGSWFYEMIALGYNYRLTDIACALGLSQLPRLDENLDRRRKIASVYSAAFQEMNAIRIPVVSADSESAWHLYPIRLKLENLKATRKEFFQAMRAENIGVNVHYIPVHLHPYYRNRFGYRGGEFPIAEAAYDSLISLPMFHGMSDQDVKDVIEAVKKVTDAFSR